ncbi:MAG: hypothetical protein GXO05_00550, partial [Aquificae bacterium]|nr:hypothetical protein [Aquificota bacterium]
MLKEGMFYWEYSLEHLDDFPDPYYINDVIIIHPEEKKEFLDNVKRLRDLITAYCSLRENGINDGISKIISKIKEILLNVENINYT